MELWEKQHIDTLLPSFIVMIVLGFILRMWLRKKSEKIRMIPLQICTIFLLAIEVIKQIKSFEGGEYDLYSLPLHFCSLFLYMLPLMCFYNGKNKDKVRAITTMICGSLFVLMTIYPGLIYGGGNIDNFFNGLRDFRASGDIKDLFNNFLDFHTVAFHTVATFTFVIIIALDLHKPNYARDAKACLIFIICYCAIAGIAAQVLQTNYNNFYNCNVPPLQAVKEMLEPILGYGITQALYVVIVSIVDIIFTQLVYFIYRILRSPLKHTEDVRDEYDMYLEY